MTAVSRLSRATRAVLSTAVAPRGRRPSGGVPEGTGPSTTAAALKRSPPVVEGSGRAASPGISRAFAGILRFRAWGGW